jgi:hypothetical protein
MSSPAGSHRLLIVDDERIIAETLTSIFTERGCVARAARAAEEPGEVLAGGIEFERGPAAVGHESVESSAFIHLAKCFSNFSHIEG